MLNNALSELLRELAQRQHCRQAALLTRAGSLVGLAGEEPLKDRRPAKTLAALATGLGAGGRELCRLLGEEPPNWLLVRGVRQTSVVAEMPNAMLLVLVFPFDAMESDVQVSVEWMAEQMLALSPARLAAGDRWPVEAQARDRALRELDEIFA